MQAPFQKILSFSKSLSGKNVPFVMIVENVHLMVSDIDSLLTVVINGFLLNVCVGVLQVVRQCSALVNAGKIYYNSNR